MRAGIIVSAIGKDRPGIVDRLSGIIFQEGCNLEDSRMAILGGEFAIIALATGAEAALAKLKEALPAAAAELGLTLNLRPTRLDDGPRAGAPRALPYRITAVAMDHPGIVHRIAGILAKHGANVAALETRVTHAPTTGTPVFSLAIEAHVPADIPIARLRTLLDKAADEENLDLDLHAIH